MCIGVFAKGIGLLVLFVVLLLGLLFVVCVGFALLSYFGFDCFLLFCVSVCGLRCCVDFYF